MLERFVIVSVVPFVAPLNISVSPQAVMPEAPLPGPPTLLRASPSHAPSASVPEGVNGKNEDDVNGEKLDIAIAVQILS